MSPTADTPVRSIAAPMQELGEGLYAFTGSGELAMRFYVLTEKPTTGDLSFDTFWNNGNGWCIFTPVDLAKLDIPSYTALAREKLPPIQPSRGNASYILWLETADSFETDMSLEWLPGQNIGSSSNTASFVCDRIKLDLTVAVGAMSYKLNDSENGSAPWLTLVAETSSAQFFVDDVLQNVGMPINPLTSNSVFWAGQIALAGPQAGTLAMPLALDLGTTADQFGFETTYQYVPSQIAENAPRSDAVQSVRMPLFPPQAAAPRDNDGFCAFNVLLNPFQPHAADASGIRVDRAGRMLGGSDATGTTQAQQVANARALTSPYAAAANGAVVALTPADPLEEGLAFDAYVGGGFSYSPPKSGGTGQVPPTPMTPSGVFVPDTNAHADPVARAAAPVAAPATVDIMPGLFALDFVRMAPGDRLLFETGHPAYIPPPDTSAGTLTVQSETTTSYVSVLKGPAASGRAYFGQSSTANLYLPDENAGAGLLAAALAQLSPLNDTPAFPMLFVGGLFLDHPENGPINPGLTADIVTRLDQKAIGPKRHSELLDAPDGPKVQLPVEMNARMMHSAAMTHPVITPQGYIVDVDENGIFTDITLGVGTGTAISPNALRFDGDETSKPRKVAPEVSTLLTRENLFMVATKAGAKWNFQDRIEVAGFEFAVTLDQADGDSASGQTPAILIIKLDQRRSLRSMALDPTSWTNGGAYVDDVDGIIARLTALFKIADAPPPPNGEDPFGAFRTLVDLTSWTGVIAFDTPIDGNGMPADLQMLLGGIPGQLRAHHVGIQTSKVTQDEVAQSSVFGVINYHREAQDAVVSKTKEPEYEVAELVAQISNSALVQLHVTVDLIVYDLLGREVHLAITKEQAATGEEATTEAKTYNNTLSIKGRYQKHGDVGRVTFSTEDPFIFEPVIDGEGVVRVVESIHITHASLVPVASEAAEPSLLGDGPTKHVAAHFTLDGQIFFAEAPFAGADGLDLFSYGKPVSENSDKVQGLNFAGLTVSVDFDLDQNGAMVDGSKVVKLLESTLNPTATPIAVRPQSLLGSLPMQLSAFEVADPETNTKVGAGAKSVNILQLMATPSALEDRKALQALKEAGEEVAPASMPGSPYTTTVPTYGLTYNISLGSLGELSDAHAGLSAALVLGWGPSPTVPDNDAACVMVALPSLSAGYQGFDLQGFISTKFEGANLLKVDVEGRGVVYAMSFDNVQLAIFGFGLPPGVLIEFLLFSGNQPDATGKVADASSIGWVLSATPKSADEDAEEDA